MIDVVVPIYNAFDVTQKCLKLLSEHDDCVEDVYIINDASSDDRVHPFLNKMAKQNSWALINNDKNLGFVKTANIGLKISQNHTVLLNSDAFVTRYWIHGFKEALEICSDLGTLTPWSNNAELASFPDFLSVNEALQEPNRFTQWLRAFHKPHYPEVPTAVGFCMLITKQAKEIVGYFDEDHFGHGYGEENDYSLRVAQAGLRNILCDNSYVEHLGNQSFVDMGLKPNEATMQRLLEKHPNYFNLIQDYIDKDPLKELRKRIISEIQIFDQTLLKKKI